MKAYRYSSASRLTRLLGVVRIFNADLYNASRLIRCLDEEEVEMN